IAAAENDEAFFSQIFRAARWDFNLSDSVGQFAAADQNQRPRGRLSIGCDRKLGAADLLDVLLEFFRRDLGVLGGFFSDHNGRRRPSGFDQPKWLGYRR